MKNQVLLSHDFCRLPPAKVFLLGIATFGLYLVYWYERQYARSAKVPRSAFIDFLKSYFFMICSFKLADKINFLLGNQQPARLSEKSYFFTKFLLIIALEGIFYAIYSIHVFWLAALIVESAYASMLQTVINEYSPQLHDQEYPWQRFDLFHLVVLVLGLSIILFLQLSADPWALLRK